MSTDGGVVAVVGISQGIGGTDGAAAQQRGVGGYRVEGVAPVCAVAHGKGIPSFVESVPHHSFWRWDPILRVSQ